MAARGRRRRFDKNQTILSEGATAGALYYILSGSVSVRRTDEHGEEALLVSVQALAERAPIWPLGT